MARLRARSAGPVINQYNAFIQVICELGEGDFLLMVSELQKSMWFLVRQGRNINVYPRKHVSAAIWYKVVSLQLDGKSCHNS